MKNRQVKAIQNMSDKEVVFYLYITQLILFLITILLGFILFDNWDTFTKLWTLHDRNILIYGGGSAAIVIAIDFLLMNNIPQELFDDGGINKKAFEKRTIPHICLLTSIIAFVEEALFRGVLQTSFGLITASLIFALLHFRYLTKWLLFISVVLLSFLLGVIFERTDNLLVTVFSHFLIDFVFALKIRADYLKESDE